MRNYIEQFCKKQEWPKEAEDTILKAWDDIMDTPAAAEKMQQWLNAYDEDIHMDYTAAIADMKTVAQLIEVSNYTTELLLFVALSRHTRELYLEKGISMQVFKDSMLDLRWKLFECHKLHGVWGSFAAFWFPGFFDLTRFALGRLQFEKIPLPEKCAKVAGEGKKLPDTALNVHIPSCGPLTVEACDDAFRQAAEFFHEDFPDGEIPVCCFSWLLFEGHREMLPEQSNIRRFQDRFTVFETFEENGDLWRVFGTRQIEDVEALPEKTSLQRAYKKWLLDGKTAGGSNGVFFITIK